MGLCRNYHTTDELARDSLTCSKTHHTDQCQSAQTENINGTGAALTDIALSDGQRILVEGPMSLASVVGLVQGLTA